VHIKVGFKEYNFLKLRIRHGISIGCHIVSSFKELAANKINKASPGIKKKILSKYRGPFVLNGTIHDT